MHTHDKEIFIQVKQEGVCAKTQALVSEREPPGMAVLHPWELQPAHGDFAKNMGLGHAKAAGRLLPGRNFFFF